MQIIISTRGSRPSEDYRWFAEDQVREWWKPCEQMGWVLTAYADTPCLVFHSEGTDWKILIGGVPSSRIDHVQRPIGFTLVLSGDATDTGDVDCVLALIKLWLDDLGRARAFENRLSISGGRLSEALDELFPERFIEGWFDGTEHGPGVEIASDPAHVEPEHLHGHSYEMWERKAEEFVKLLRLPRQARSTMRSAKEPGQSDGSSDEERPAPLEDERSGMPSLIKLIFSAFAMAVAALLRFLGLMRSNHESRSEMNDAGEAAGAVVRGVILSADDRSFFLDRAQKLLRQRRSGVALYANPGRPGESVQEIEGLPLVAVLCNPPGIKAMRAAPRSMPAGDAQS